MRKGYEKDLQATRKFLRKPKTAAQVAEHFEISRFAAYERINALCALGQAEADGFEKAVRTGPKAWLYRAR